MVIAILCYCIYFHNYHATTLILRRQISACLRLFSNSVLQLTKCLVEMENDINHTINLNHHKCEILVRCNNFCKHLRINL